MFAFRRALAGLVLLGAVAVAVRIIARYRERTGEFFAGNGWRPSPTYTYATPWWAIAIAVTMGLFAAALAALMYPRHDHFERGGMR